MCQLAPTWRISLGLPHVMSTREPRTRPTSEEEQRVRKSFAAIISNGNFKRLADMGFVDLEEPQETTPGGHHKKNYQGQESRHQKKSTEGLLSQQIQAEYSCWIHDAWEDFIERMSRTTDRPTLRLGDDLEAHCSVHLCGWYHGKKICTRTHLTFCHVKLPCFRHLYQWKVKLEPEAFMPAFVGPGPSTTTCSCILECCCVNRCTRDTIEALTG